MSPTLSRLTYSWGGHALCAMTEVAMAVHYWAGRRLRDFEASPARILVTRPSAYLASDENVLTLDGAISELVLERLADFSLVLVGHGAVDVAVAQRESRLHRLLHLALLRLQRHGQGRRQVIRRVVSPGGRETSGQSPGCLPRQRGDVRSVIGLPL